MIPAELTGRTPVTQRDRARFWNRRDFLVSSKKWRALSHDEDIVLIGAALIEEAEIASTKVLATVDSAADVARN